MPPDIRAIAAHDRLDVQGTLYLVTFHHMTHLDVEDMTETYHIELVEEGSGHLTATHYLEYIKGSEDVISLWTIDRTIWAKIDPAEIALVTA